jgi:hypothetical protein
MRNPGQLPPRLRTDHTHDVDHVVDPVTGEPADLGGSGGAPSPFEVLDENGGTIASIASVSGLVVQDPDGASLLRYGLWDGHLQVKNVDGDVLIEAYAGQTNFGPDSGVGVQNDPVSGLSFLFMSATAAPPDAFIFRGSCWLWFDKTEGAAKLMLKGKDQGDNIVTAEIPLA